MAGWLDPDENNAYLALTHRFFPQGRVWQYSSMISCILPCQIRILLVYCIQFNMISRDDPEADETSDFESETDFETVEDGKCCG